MPTVPFRRSADHQEFAGEDVVLPEHREKTSETQTRLREAAKAVGLRRLPAEPEEEMVQAYLTDVSDSFEHLGYARTGQ